MTIEFLNWITRDMLRARPDDVFVFGDNTKRVGFGGQAKEMRDEPNAIGIATKWAPGMEEDDFFADWHSKAWTILNEDIGRVEYELYSAGRIVWVPSAGLGTGLSRLPEKAPRMHAYLVSRFQAMAFACNVPFPDSWRR